MAADIERRERLQDAMKESGLDGIVCTLPSNVLLATGYFPVMGTSIAVATCDGDVVLFVPRDELDLSECAAMETIPFEAASLGTMAGAVSALRGPVRDMLRRRGLDQAVLGYECGSVCEPASYISMHLYQQAVVELFEAATLRPASELLARVKSVLTMIECDRLRRACRIAGEAFQAGAARLESGVREADAAAGFAAPLFTRGTGFEGVTRAGGYAACMSGPNSARAGGAYARSRGREIEISDLVLTHVNSHADGYWTDITRTYIVGPAGERAQALYAAVFEARRAAFDAIRPGVPAADVDRAARGVLARHGYAECFPHATGHGVGFAATDHGARPRLNPASTDILERGMVFNVEPAIYLEGFGGIRHCDMVGVTATGMELLTPFHSNLDGLLR